MLEHPDRSLDVIATVLLAREIYKNDERKLLVAEYQNLLIQDKDAAIKLNLMADSPDSENRKIQHERKVSTGEALLNFEKKHSLIRKIVQFSVGK